MRQLNETVSQMLIGDTYHYFVYFRGDELLLNAKNDADAVTEGEALNKELESL
jgi:hypothetical protein